MKSIRTIFFDLDGTLTDPLEGIAGCIRYSLEQLEIPCPPNKELASYIGPPLRQSFAAICRSDDSDLIERAIALYRERFSTIGLYENTIYAGVPEMLSGLRGLSLDLFVATSKPEVYARRIVEHFAFDSYFTDVRGNELGGRLDNKADLLHELLESQGLSPEETIMVGDRKHDVLAAQAHGIRSLGVTYGYGSLEELQDAGADIICDSPLAVLEYIREAC
jgi:phosphoglycolate phosphatase